MIDLLSITSVQLKRAVKLQANIARMEKQLASILGAPATKTAKPVKRRKMSASARAKIAAAQRARWAKVNAGKSAAKPAKRKMSAAGRARIAAAQKARWAKIKAAKK